VLHQDRQSLEHVFQVGAGIDLQVAVSV